VTDRTTLIRLAALLATACIATAAPAQQAPVTSPRPTATAAPIAAVDAPTRVPAHPVARDAADTRGIIIVGGRGGKSRRARRPDTAVALNPQPLPPDPQPPLKAQ